jgi:hypothetical protein
MTITAELADGRRLEFPDGTDPGVIQNTVKKVLGKATPEMKEPAFEREARELLSVTTPELIAGSRPMRFALGAAAPFLGATQLVAEALGDKTGTKTLTQLEKMKQAGMKAYGQEGVDIAGIGGTVMSPAFLAAGKAITPAATTLGKMAQGAAIGAAAGATTPVTNEEDYWSSKGGQTLVGTALGGLIPGTIEFTKAFGRGVRNIGNMFTQKGAEKILSRYQTRIVGEENIPQVAQALRGATEILPGGKPTAAQALAQTPAGSPLIAHQRITATTPGGISAQFGQRKIEQEAAIKAAEQARNAITEPMREAALDAANQVGGVRASLITSRIDEMAAQPGQRASEVVQKALAETKDKIAKAIETGGKLDARDLYTIRKEVGNTIEKFAKETASWDKRLTAGLQRDIQKAMDDAIEASGGTGWKAYLNEYAQRSQMIDAFKDRILKAARPAQRTELGGGVNVAEEMRLKAPQLLSRPMMATNFILRKLGQGVEEKIDPAAAKRYLNPELLAAELEKVPLQWRPAIVSDLINRGRIPALAGGIQATVQE